MTATFGPPATGPSDSGGYYWVDGTWQFCPPTKVPSGPPATGVRRRRRLLLEWRLLGTRSIGFYGGIDYGFGYFGTGFYGGYWNGGRFFYNRAYWNVGRTSAAYGYTQRFPGHRWRSPRRHFLRYTSISRDRGTAVIAAEAYNGGMASTITVKISGGFDNTHGYNGANGFTTRANRYNHSGDTSRRPPAPTPRYRPGATTTFTPGKATPALGPGHPRLATHQFYGGQGLRRAHPVRQLLPRRTNRSGDGKLQPRLQSPHRVSAARTAAKQLTQSFNNNYRTPQVAPQSSIRARGFAQAPQRQHYAAFTPAAAALLRSATAAAPHYVRTLAAVAVRSFSATPHPAEAAEVVAVTARSSLSFPQGRPANRVSLGIDHHQRGH